MAKTKVEIHDEIEEKFSGVKESKDLPDTIIRDTVTGIAMGYRTLAHRVVDITPVVKAQNDAVDGLFTSYENAVSAIVKNLDKMGDVFNGVG